MANETSKPAGADGPKPDESIEQLKIELERKKLATLILMLDYVHNFFEFDKEANNTTLNCAKIAADWLSKNPDKAFTGGSSDIEALRNALKGAAAPKGGGVTGGDIVGGDVIDDIVKFIDELIKLITGGEKDFFLAIIQLIFCGCPK
jgi:hypothetical protein